MTALDWQAIARRHMHPLRAEILEALIDSELAPTDFAARRNGRSESIGVVSHHFRSLAELGLIRVVRTEQHRGALKHVYALSSRARLGLRR